MSNDLVAYQQQMAALAAQYASSEPVAGGNFISTKGGILALNGEPLLGNQLCAVVLDYVWEFTYYGSGTYDPDHSAPPTCYAFGRGENDMAPHPSMQADLAYFRPEAYECKECPMNRWGSADQGKGKACQNRRRLALAPAGFYKPIPRSRDFDLHLFDDPQHYAGCDLAFLKLPVMSVGKATDPTSWIGYVKMLASSHRRPPAGVITRIYIEPDPKSQYRVKFELVDMVPDALLGAVLSRVEQAKDTIVSGYAPPSDDGVAA